jgi:hypothetical protein
MGKYRGARDRLYLGGSSTLGILDFIKASIALAFFSQGKPGASCAP